jgi:hypothetical protein
LNRGRAPAAIDAGTEQMIEQVISRRNRIEHSGDAIGRFVGRRRHEDHKDELATKVTKVTMF